MGHIDAIDERILLELQANGRLTMKALAERVGLSSPAMIERVRRLEDRGVIAGYRAIVAPQALGRPLTALIAVAVEGADHDLLLDRVNSEPAIVECHRTTGDADYLLKAHVAEPAALEEVIDALGAAGGRRSSVLVLSSPIPWREITPPPGATNQRARLTRRRTTPTSASTTEHDMNGYEPSRSRRPGRPRGNRAAS